MKGGPALNRLKDQRQRGEQNHREDKTTLERQHQVYLSKGPRRVSPFTIPMMIGNMGMEGLDMDLQGMLDKMMPKSSQQREATVEKARETLLEQKCDELLDDDLVHAMAIDLAENMGIVFLDEMDKVIGSQGKSADVSRQGVQRDLLPIVEDYAINELMPVIAKGGYVTQRDREEAASRMAQYSGISKASILSYNLDVPTSFFWKELLREEGYTIGRLDSRYKGIDKTKGGERPDFNSELTSWLHSFTPAVNYYYKNVLNFKTDVKYNMFGPVHPWDRENNHTGKDLRQAMATNPYLNVMIQSGYYDGATNYFDAKYTMTQLDPSGKMKDRLRFKGYRSGHMMYLRYEDLKTANDDIRTFISDSLPAKDQAAKYDR